jgi:hypothetical protein
LAGRRQKAAAQPGLVIVTIVDGAERGGEVVVRVCEKSAGNSFNFFLGQVPGQLTAKYASFVIIRHDFSFLN